MRSISTSRRWARDVRAIALSLVFVFPLTAYAVVQAMAFHGERVVLQREVRGQACVARMYDLFAYGLRAGAAMSVGDAPRVTDETRSCAPGAREWPSIENALTRGPVRRQRASAFLGDVGHVMLAIGDGSGLTFDSNPVVIGLGVASSYDLPAAQRSLVSGPAAPDTIAIAKAQARGTDQLFSMRYDLQTAFAHAPELGRALNPQLRRTMDAGHALAFALDAREASGAGDPARLVRAVRAFVLRSDALERAIAAAEASDLRGALDRATRRETILWFAYAVALGALGLGTRALDRRLAIAAARAVADARREALHEQAERARELAEQVLDERQARFQSVFADSPLAIAIARFDGTILECNRAYLALCGPTTADNERRTVLDRVTVEPRGAMPALFGAIAANGRDTSEADVRLSDRGGERGWFHATVSAVANRGPKPTECTIVLQDITERRAREARLRDELLRDKLTGLANRNGFIRSAVRALEVPHRGEPRCALLFVDIDDFKAINDTLGHAAGDACLRVVASRIASAVRDSDLAARFGGDEFALLLANATSIENAHVVARRIALAVQAPIAVPDATIGISVSVGVAIDDPSYGDIDALLARADAAMYETKRLRPERRATIDPIARVASLG